MLKVSDVIAATRVQSRPYQRRIVSKMVDMFLGRYKNGAGELEPNARSVMIESPTGSGKTVMGLIGARTLQLELEKVGVKLAVGWVAMRRNLLSQAAAENGDYCKELNPTGKGINVENLFMISMFDKRPAELIELKKKGYVILLVVDEAQHDAATSAAHLHNIIAPDYILGLSATPFRTDRVKLCFDKVIKDAGIHQLIQDDFLSRYHQYTIPSWTVGEVFEHYMRDVDRWGKSAFYFKSLSECFELSKLFDGVGKGHYVVTGDSDVEEQLRGFRAGEHDVVINCLKLTEGWDEPSLKTAWIRPSGKGPTMQMGGRVFRIYEGLPFKQIVQCKHTRWPMIRTAMPEQQLVWQEDAWLSLTVNPQLNTMNQNARQAIAQAVVELPRFLTERKKKVKKLRF